MGGGRQFPYPKWVWSPSGGWWANPVNKYRNTGLYVAFVIVPVITYAWIYCDQNTVSFTSGFLAFPTRKFLVNKSKLLSPIPNLLHF